MDQQINYYQSKLKFEIDSADLYNTLQSDSKIQIVDARKEKAFIHEHIPFSINLPHREINFDTTKHLDKTTLYVVYCDGIGCNASTKGALKLAELGFKTKELIGGIDWWKRDGFTTQGTNGTNGIQIECNC
jgi:rhodanese-related sulfurtransferase